MRKTALALAVLALALAPLAMRPTPASAAGNLAAKPVTLDPLVFDGRDLSFSQKEYNLETGKYYKWVVQSKGGEEFQLFFPDLFRLASVVQMRVNTVPEGQPAQFVEVHTVGPIYHLEFDSPGQVEIFFLAISPGDVTYYLSGFQQKGMTGVMHIK